MSTAASRPVPRKGVLDIAAYVPGKSKAPAGVKLHKLSANETPLGPSPRVHEALAGLAGRLEIYPDGQSSILREAIAETYGLNPRNILCGNGSGELLQFLCAAYLTDGDEAIYTAHAFSIYEIYTRANGATPIVVPEADLRADVDAMLAAVSPRTRIVFLANPNNPTGSYLPFDEVRRLHAGLPGEVLLVLDAAYAEYVRRNDYESGVELVSASANVVMTRTLSKIYGLASLRIGWIYAPEAVVDALDRIRPPFNLNAAALAAGAAAIRDREHVARAAAHNAEWLDWLTSEIRALGLVVAPSVANFVLIHFPETPGRTAAEADAFLTARGYILRGVSSYGLPNALRMTVGSEEANRGAAAALKEFLAS